jgi:hypothetical protein
MIQKTCTDRDEKKGRSEDPLPRQWTSEVEDKKILAHMFLLQQCCILSFLLYLWGVNISSHTVIC